MCIRDSVNRLVNQPTVDFNDIGEAIKAALGELGQMSKNVSNAMKIAGSLSESALSEVAKMIPIVDVITNSIAVAGGISEAVPNAMRYGSNLGDIYLARAADRPEMVLALKRLGQRNAQLLEQSLYKTGSAITKLGLGIAQLATAGTDMGATTALKDGVAGVKSKARGMSDAAVDVKTLAEARTAVDGKERGFGWKMKMWFKSNGALARRVAAHNVQNDTSLETAKGKRQSRFESKGEDPGITQPKVQDALIKEMENMSVDELQAAAKDPKRSQFERIVFSQAAAEKLKAEMAKGSKGSKSGKTKGGK